MLIYLCEIVQGHVGDVHVELSFSIRLFFVFVDQNQRVVYLCLHLG